MTETTSGRSGARRSTSFAFQKFGLLAVDEPEAAGRFKDAAETLAMELSGTPTGTPLPEGLHQEALAVILVAWVEGRLKSGLPEVPRDL